MPFGHLALREFRPGLHRLVVMAAERSVIDALGLQEDHRIVVLDRRDEQALGVVGRGRDHRLDAGDMGEQRLGALAVRLAAEDAAAVRRADGDRHGEIAGRAIADARRLRHDLVEAGIDVIGELHFHHGAQAVGAHADGGGDDAAFRDRRIEGAGQAVLLLQPVGDAEDAAEIAGILAEGEHVGILRHHHVEGGVERLDHVHLRHDQCPVCWRWRRRCSGTSLKTSSNMVATLGSLFRQACRGSKLPCWRRRPVRPPLMCAAW